MYDTLAGHEPMMRLGAFFATALAMASWEAFAPRRALARGRLRRWPVNLALVALNTALVRALFPAAFAAAAAAWAESRGLGLLNVLSLPPWLAIALAVVALDLAIYAQHVAFHYFSPLWRLHRVHHADLDIDFTTGVRFHPVEILLSLAIKTVVVVALGAPAAAVVIFEIALNASSMFNHGNVRLTPMLDGALRALVVTPDMHRVHHSILRAETDSNFGFCLSVWDRLFGTYRAEPAAGHNAMTIGLPTFREDAAQGLWSLLLNPFRRTGEAIDTKSP